MSDLPTTRPIAELEEKSEDPIKGTDMKRVIMQHVCPYCGSPLDCDRDTWIRQCEICLYSYRANV